MCWCPKFSNSFRGYWKPRDQAKIQIRDLKPKNSSFTRPLLKYQSRQPPANRELLLLNQKRNWKRSGEFAEKKLSKTELPAVLAVDIKKKKLNDELLALISWLYPTLWTLLSYLNNCSFIFQEYIRAKEFSHRQTHYTYLQMSYIMMQILCTGMFWGKVETMQQFPFCFISYRTPKEREFSLLFLLFQMWKKGGYVDFMVWQ